MEQEASGQDAGNWGLTTLSAEELMRLLTLQRRYERGEYRDDVPPAPKSASERG